jgi:hypothetical protein
MWPSEYVHELVLRLKEVLKCIVEKRCDRSSTATFVEIKVKIDTSSTEETASEMIICYGNKWWKYDFWFNLKHFGLMEYAYLWTIGSYALKIGMITCTKPLESVL